jgi:energy-coupling factor transporter ATP-binding protein EcfA2
MALPVELASIFRNKHKSYKMVLMLSMIDTWKETKNKHLPIDNVSRRFLSYYQYREASNLKADIPPQQAASRWAEMTLSQTRRLIDTPIEALRSIITKSDGGSSLTFHQQIWAMAPDVFDELQRYANEELDAYNEQIWSGFSLKESLDKILGTYSIAKTQSFSSHPLGSLFRRTIPEGLKELPFITKDIRVQGSVGQGNWATVPWIALMDKRITETTQHGEYLVYLFAEDMSAVYLTLNQGVTEPIKEKGRKEGYVYLQNKVDELREQLPLNGLTKDDNIQLTASGIGRDYQVSTVAYIRYDQRSIPEDKQLFADLENLMENYQLYVEAHLKENKQKEQYEPATFKYTMANLYLGQGIINYIGQNGNGYFPIEIDELIQNQSTVLKSGDEVKFPKERIRHIGRALEELGLLRIINQSYSLTEFGVKYAQRIDELDLWKLTDGQATLLRQQLQASASNRNTTNLIKVINQAVSIARELQNFTTSGFHERFIQSMGLEEEWGTVTQENRTKFMLNWLEELRYIEKTHQTYRYIDDEVEDVLDSWSVSERLGHIKLYIQNKGFMYPDGLIENFYLSLKTKPFVILAGVSGTGKTKLIKLFAEALGATTENGQFALIPVRPDWNDPSDLIGYKDLSGVFRPGRLAEVLYEASKPVNQNKPYFICLDEMNLARVEHYFSDLLSVMETQEWRDERIITVPLIHRSSLTIEEDQIKYGELSVPDNIYLIGTVNMDETTHPFSKKVLDRANTIEFNYINLSIFPDYEQTVPPKPIAALNTFLKSEYLQLVDAYTNSKELVTRVTNQLVHINTILEEIHAHVGFRIRDAACFYVIYSQRHHLLSENEAFDNQLFQKILPRIQGSSASIKSVLLKLMNECSATSLAITELMDDASQLYAEGRLKEVLSRAKYPQSARKIAFMLRRLEEDGFTSYWLS